LTALPGIPLSVITINYNNGEGLKRTMPSVFAQTLPGIEYIVIDGGSDDDSRSYISEHTDRLAHWVSEKDNGIYHAMNKGIARARGHYLLFLNSGDHFAGDRVCENMLWGEDGSIDLIYGNLERTYPNGYTDTVKMPEQLTPEFMIGQVLCHPVTFIRKGLFDEHGGYDESLRIISDWAFFLKAVVIGKASSKYKDVSVAMFYMDGLSSAPESQPVIAGEKKLVMSRYFAD